MSSQSAGHPGDDLLLRHADGETSGRELRELRTHLENCPRCRAALEEIESASAVYRRCQTRYPAPPSPWDDLSPHFDQAERLLRKPAWTSAGKWIGVAAGLTVAWLAAQRLTDTPSAKAAELLRKAVAAEAAPSSKPRRIEIRTRSRRLTRVLGSRLASAGGEERDALASLEAKFRAANYSWDDPLSARSYQQWRSQLPEKRDTVAAIEEGGASWYRIRTSTGSGALREASLKLRSADLRPVEGTLEFRNDERVEIAEALEEIPAPPPAPPRLTVHDEHGGPPPPAPVLATAGDELRVLAALHRLGADLGEPVEVTRQGPQVLVTGIGLDPQRAAEIRGAVAGIPRAAVRFSDPAAAPAPPDAGAAARPPEPAGEPSGLQAQLEKTLGGRAVFEQFSEVVLEKTEALMARAHALRRLSQRFSPAAEAQLDAREFALLAAMRKDLAASFGKQHAELQRSMAAAVRPRQPAPLSPPAATWQQAAEDLFQAASRFDRLVAVAFGGAPPSGPPPGPADLAAGLAGLRATWSSCETKIQPE